MQTVRTQATELLIVDAAIDNAPELLDGRRAGVEILHLTPNGRGLEQII